MKVAIISMLFMPVLAFANLGETVYSHACSNCHTPKVADGVGAPPAHNTHAWARRIIDAQKAIKEPEARFPSVYDYLLYSVKIGKGMMHHGRLCKESLAASYCTDKALLSAIVFMSKPRR